MNNPLVSVIIPNYCHARYLDERLQSVLGQTYENFEVIILDDCSPDNGASKAVIDKYKSNPHISHIVYNEVNSGSTFKQWQKGFKLVKGELIWIAESDDYCDACFLDVLVHEFVKYEDCVIAYSTLIEINSDSKIIGKVKISADQHYSGIHYLKHYLSLANFIRNASCAVFRKSAAVNIGQEYINYLGAGDYLFWVEIIKQGSVSIINRQLNYFRRHETVVTSKRDADGSNFRAEKEIFDYIKTIVCLNYFHNRLAYAYRANRLRKISFISEEIKREIYKLWNVEGHDKFIDKLLLRIFFKLVVRYNYYI